MDATVHVYGKIVYTVADPGFPRSGCTNVLFCKFVCQKLHENKRIWNEGEGAFLAPPWMRRCCVRLLREVACSAVIVQVHIWKHLFAAEASYVFHACDTDTKPIPVTF